MRPPWAANRCRGGSGWTRHYPGPTGRRRRMSTAEQKVPTRVNFERRLTLPVAGRGNHRRPPRPGTVKQVRVEAALVAARRGRGRRCLPRSPGGRPLHGNLHQNLRIDLPPSRRCVGLGGPFVGGTWLIRATADPLRMQSVVADAAGRFRKTFPGIELRLWSEGLCESAGRRRSVRMQSRAPVSSSPASKRSRRESTGGLEPRTGFAEREPLQVCAAAPVGAGAIGDRCGHSDPGTGARICLPQGRRSLRGSLARLSGPQCPGRSAAIVDAASEFLRQVTWVLHPGPNRGLIAAAVRNRNGKVLHDRRNYPDKGPAPETQCASKIPGAGHR